MTVEIGVMLSRKNGSIIKERWQLKVSHVYRRVQDRGSTPLAQGQRVKGLTLSANAQLRGTNFFSRAKGEKRGKEADRPVLTIGRRLKGGKVLSYPAHEWEAWGRIL